MGRRVLWILMAGMTGACGNAGSGDQSSAPPASAPVVAQAPAQAVDAARNAFPVGNWMLTSLQGDAVDGAAGVALDVLEDGKFAGNGGCNRYFGNMGQADGQLTVGPVGSTMMACEQAAMDLEHRFLRALEQVAGFALDGGQLLLKDGQGQILMAFAPKPAGGPQGQ